MKVYRVLDHLLSLELNSELQTKIESLKSLKTNTTQFKKKMCACYLDERFRSVKIVDANVRSKQNRFFDCVFSPVLFCVHTQEN